MTFLDGEFDDGCSDYDETQEYQNDFFDENYDDDDPFFLDENNYWN